MTERLITWVDVLQAVLRDTDGGKSLPQGLATVRCYWDGLSLVVSPNASGQLRETWLKKLFGPSFTTDEKGDQIALVSHNGDARSLPINWEEVPVGEEMPPVPWLPLFRVPRRLPTTLPPIPDAWSEECPVMVAFHSFKGGVGRTTHALALAQMLRERGAKILLVDADMEAPGISWLLHSRFPVPALSFADFVTLAHGDSSEDYELTVKLVVQELQKLREDDIHFLPAFRSNEQFEELEIRPEHLIEGQRNPFILSDLLSRVGKLLGVDYVIVDLRAGMSELASGFLFDPRIHRVFVTTLSAQSRKGVEMLLDTVLPTAGKGDYPGVAVVVAQVPSDWTKGAGAQRIEELLDPLVKRIIGLDAEGSEAADELPMQSVHPLVQTNFSQDLAVLPENLADVMDAIARSGITKDALPLLEWLPERQHPQLPAIPVTPSSLTLDERRRKLANFSRQLIFAESGETWDFLSTVPLRNLAADNSNSVPIALIIGAKGAGKTYSYLQLARAKTWEEFSGKLLPSSLEVSHASVLPVLSSLNLKPAAQEVVDNARAACAASLNLIPPVEPLDDRVRDWLQQDLHEGQWRSQWLDLIAWSAGFEIGKEGAGSRFPQHLISRKITVVACFDGLEDMFQSFLDNERQATALRSLLQDVPNWLEKIPGRPLGLAAFVRQDIVERTIKQNAAHLRSRYEPYALRWNRTEALKLVKWALVKSGVITGQLPDGADSTTSDELEKDLQQLWGRKLGREDGKNANSAKFVTLALSDYSGRLQARDLIRFLAEAAQKSIGNSDWTDRLLAPTAVQLAIKECGREKIGEIKAENPKVGFVLDRLIQNAANLRIPARREELNLTPEDVGLLESNAVLFKDGEDYYMPEFLRQGMGLQLRGGSRPKLFSLLALRNKD